MSVTEDPLFHAPARSRGGADGRVASRHPRVGGLVCQLAAPGRLEFLDLPTPEPRQGEAVVRINRVGICGTDLHFFNGRPRGGPWSGGPWVLGHDAAGIVEGVGEGADALMVGKRVTVDPKITCGVCNWCRAGTPELCTDQSYLGMSAPGCLAELVAVPADQLALLPDSVSDDAATVLEPVAVALELESMVLPILGAKRPVAVVGGGPLGVVVASVLQESGWPVQVFELVEFRREMALRVGIVSRPPVPVDIGQGPRLVVETSGSVDGVALAEGLCTTGSVIGIVGAADAGITTRTLLSRAITLVPVRGGAGRYPEAVRLSAGHGVVGEQLITHRHPLSAAQEAFEEAASQADQVMRSVIDMPRRRPLATPEAEGSR